MAIAIEYGVYPIRKMALVKQNESQPKPTLVELAKDVQDSLEIYQFALDFGDTETMTECEKQLENSINQFGSKLEACYFAAKMLNKEGDALIEEANSMKEKAGIKKKAASRIIDMVKHVILSSGNTYKGEYYKFIVCSNSVAPVWKQQDVNSANVPDEFVVTETIQHIDWKSIEKLAKESEDGCVYGKNGEIIAKVLPRGKHVRIK